MSATRCDYTCRGCGQVYSTPVRLNTPEIKTLYCKKCTAVWRKAHRKKSMRWVDLRNKKEGMRFVGKQSEPSLPNKNTTIKCGKCGSDITNPQYVLCENCERIRKEERERCNGAPDEIIKWANNAIYSHRARGHTIKFSLDELITLALNTGDECPICGEKFSNMGNGSFRSYDRISNSRSYDIHDIGIICVKCNTIKGNRTPQEMSVYLHNFLNYLELHHNGG